MVWFFDCRRFPKLRKLMSVHASSRENVQPYARKPIRLQIRHSHRLSIPGTVLYIRASGSQLYCACGHSRNDDEEIRCLRALNEALEIHARAHIAVHDSKSIINRLLFPLHKS